MTSPLASAFGELERRGMVAKHHWLCCNTCGVSAITELAVDTDKVGWCFYHGQDTEHALNSGRLYISYGSTHDDLDDLDIGHLICTTLRDHGLCAHWEDDPEERILIHLTAKDYDYLQECMDVEMEEVQTEMAVEHRIRYLFWSWRRAGFTQKVAGRKIKSAMLSYALRPGGSLFKLSQARYNDMCLSNV